LRKTLSSKAIIATAALVAPVVAVFASKGLAPIFALAGLAAVVSLARRPEKPAWPPRIYFVLLGAILVWGLASSLWALQPMDSLKLAGVLTLFVVGGLALLTLARTGSGNPLSLRRAIILGYALGLTLLAEELLLDAPLLRLAIPTTEIFYFNQGLTALALLVWPAALALHQEGRNAAASILIAATLAVLSLGESGAALAGLAGGVVTAVLLRFVPRLAVLAAVTAVAGISTAPLVVRALPSTETLRAHYSSAVTGLMPRIGIWNYTADRIAERPVAGWGLNSSRFFSSEADKSVRDPNWDITIEALPLHPHNAMLQWWLELGAVGALLFAALAGLLVHGIARGGGSPWGKAIANAQVATFLAMASVSYGIWQAWWMALLWLGMIFTTALLAREPEPRP
jgi:exopolysaccharide production protein ExoQ